MRTGDWICTYSGVKFYLTDPHPSDVLIEDIAHSLAMICRYGGHCRQFYSVAQHSALVFEFVRAWHPDDYAAQAWALLHDAAEAYLGDMVRPLKLALPAYQELEEKVEIIVMNGLGMPAPDARIRALVKHADNVLLMTERRDLVNHQEIPWTPRAVPLDAVIVPLQSSLAGQLFRHHFTWLQQSMISAATFDGVTA